MPANPVQQQPTLVSRFGYALEVLAPPAAPTVAASPTTGGTAAAGTYYAAVTYVNSAGETVGSGATSVTIVAGNEITINSPSAEGNATGWYAYVGTTASALYRQQAAGSPTAIGTNLVLAGPPSTTGAAPPVTNSANNAGTYVAPTNELWAEGLTASDLPDVYDYSVIHQSRDLVAFTRKGVEKITLKATEPLYSVMGGPLFRSAIGADTLSGSAAASVTIGAAISVGNNTCTLTMPSLPAGVADWRGVILKFTNAGGATEYKPILGVSGNTVTTLPFANAFATSDTCTMPVEHILQANTGSAVATLATISATVQLAQFAEWDLSQVFVGKFDWTGDNKQLKCAYDFVASTPNGLVPTTNLSNWTMPSAERNDSPFIMMDGGLITPFSTSDSAYYMHSRTTKLGWSFDNGLRPRVYGGGVQKTEYYTPGARKQQVTWDEDAGQYSAAPDIFNNYVKTQTRMPAWLYFSNPNNGLGVCAFFPSCAVKKYDPVMGNAEDPLGYTGEIEPLPDPSTGISVRLVLLNGQNASY